MADASASKQIDEIINLHGGWKGEVLSQLRVTIQTADPEIVEEVKWKMPSRPEGLPVWSHGGIVAFAEVWKNNVKLLFARGAQLKDEHKLFNARLKSKDIRAIEFKEGDTVNETALRALVQEAATLNKKKK